MTDKEIIKFIVDQGIGSHKGLTIGLTGPLGVGKTDLVKKLLTAISTELGRLVHSPTFNICNIYSVAKATVYHFDLYRIDCEEQLYDIDLWECMEDRKSLVIIEWVDMFSEIYRGCELIISIKEDAKGRRIYSITED